MKLKFISQTRCLSWMSKEALLIIMTQMLADRGFIFFFPLATPRTMWDLSFSARDRTQALLLWNGGALTTGLPGDF